MVYLKKIKYPLASMISENELSQDMLFIEHMAEQAIASAKLGSTITSEAYDILDKAGVAMIRAASQGIVSDEQARIFEKIMSAIQLNTSKIESADEAYRLVVTTSGSAK